MANQARTMTVEEFLALPDDGVDRWLVKGKLRESRTTRNRPATLRNRFHSVVLTRIAQVLANWLDARPDLGGHVLAGDAGVRLGKDPEWVFGIDVAYVSAEVWERQRSDSTLIEGVPVLAAEILSPSDSTEDIEEKIDAYLEAGVPLVWMVTASGVLSGEPHLPGFAVPVVRLFD